MAADSVDGRRRAFRCNAGTATRSPPTPPGGPGLDHGVDARLGRRPPRRPPVDLPTYAFQHQRYWLEPDPTTGTGTDDADVGSGTPSTGATPTCSPTASPSPPARHRGAARPRRLAGPAARRVHRGRLALPGGVALHRTARRRRTDRHLVARRPAGVDRRRAGDRPRRRLAARGADVVTVTGTDLPAGDTPAGVLSLLALDDTPDATDAGLSVGVTGTVALIQALTDTDFAGRSGASPRAASPSTGRGPPRPRAGRALGPRPRAGPGVPALLGRPGRPAGRLDR